MNNGIAKIVEFLGCDPETARQLCLDTQREFQGRTPPFAEVAEALCLLNNKRASPAEIAAQIRASGGPKPRQRSRSRRMGGGKKRTRQATQGNMKWTKVTKGSFTVDESGFLVPKGVSVRSRRAKPTVIKGPIMPPSKPEPTFSGLKRKFDQIDKAEKQERSRKRQNVLESPGSYWHNCPKCGARLRFDKLKGHMKSNHLTALSKVEFEQLALSAKPISGKSPGKNDAAPRKASTKGARLRDEFKEHNDGSKGLGHMRRERGKFGSYPIHEDHSEESEP